MRSKSQPSFEWDDDKDKRNRKKHGVPFAVAQYAFADPRRVILKDVTHSTAAEERFFCLGEVGEGILTVRFTWRSGRIRIIGAGYWRKGRKLYVEHNQL
jgi:uncharacterized DUF497 family protein